jgi:hypothetical protein
MLSPGFISLIEHTPPGDVVAYLESVAKAPLPKTGFLSGGALLPALRKLHDLPSAPIRDIDVFVKGDRLVSQRNYETFTRNVVIYDTKQDGLLNTIGCTIPNKSWSLMNLISGFDIDCTQVGIDLAKLDAGRIEFTTSFAQAITTDTLTVESIFTPARTICRLLQKAEDLQMSFATMREFMALSILFHPDNPLNRSRRLDQEVEQLEATTLKVHGAPLYCPVKLPTNPNWRSKLDPYFHVHLLKEEGKQYMAILPKAELPYPVLPKANQRWQDAEVTSAKTVQSCFEEFKMCYPRLNLNLPVENLAF